MKLKCVAIRALRRFCWLVVLTLATVLPLTVNAARTTYFDGSSQGDEAFAVATDASGNVYVAGGTQSIDLPGVSSGAQTQLGGRRDGFVAKYNATLTTLLAATYLGGSGDEVINGIAVLPSGDVVVIGQTRSDDFPGFALPAVGGAGFVVRFNSNLATTLSTLRVGQSASTTLLALAIAADGGVVVAGSTTDDAGDGRRCGRAGGAHHTRRHCNHQCDGTRGCRGSRQRGGHPCQRRHLRCG